MCTALNSTQCNLRVNRNKIQQNQLQFTHASLQNEHTHARIIVVLCEKLYGVLTRRWMRALTHRVLCVLECRLNGGAEQRIELLKVEAKSPPDIFDFDGALNG